MKKVLIIDDDVAFNRLLKEHVQDLGYQVCSAFDGSQGLDVYHDFQPDIVITDIIMPNTDGIEVILALSNETDNNCKVIVISGGGRIAGIEYLKLSKNLGAQHILEKPFSFDKLEQVLEAS